MSRLAVTPLIFLLFVMGVSNGTCAAVTQERSMALEKKLRDAYLAKGLTYKPRTEHFNEDGTPIYTNRLILQDSPYLLQHAHNPVDWYPWSEEAFAKAKEENKPVFLSIGYATCHWCHVMERESFEDPAIAALLNEHFIAIKVDRESHPDVDEVYMTAVMLLTGRGGWPMSSFLTPEGEPFYGGTYYPPQQFSSLVRQVAQIWHERESDVIAQARRIAEAIAENNRISGEAKAFDLKQAERALEAIGQIYDEIQGGFGQAPKFPQEPWLFLLLERAERDGNETALEMLENTLDQMARGGIYDQVGGGFHRYSTDYEWLVPHFEKMLYNQAHLSRIYLGAWRLTGKEKYRRVVTQTLDYVLREMTSPEGAFYSATDADSEGEEGLFFTWTLKEIRQALPPEHADLTKSLYSISRIGNFEGRNILHLEQSLETYADDHKMDLQSLRDQLDQVNAQLLKVRDQRMPPLRDDKIVTAWNGMMVTAFAKAADLLDSQTYRQAAERAGQFLWQNNRIKSGYLWRVHLDGRSSIAATQEDYAYLAEAYLALYDLNAEPVWLERAQELADALIERFHDSEDGGFFLNEADASITKMGRPKDDGSDNAIPSGTSVAMHVLQKLSRRSGQLAYQQQADTLISRFTATIEEQPHNFTYMLTAITNHKIGELNDQAYAAQGAVRLKGELKPHSDKAIRLSVELQIPKDWHINSDQPGHADLIGTKLQLEAEESGWKMGPVNYPEGSRQKLSFQEAPIALYSGETTLEALVTPGSEPPKGNTLEVSLRLQACNDQVCLPPETPALRLRLP
jgi:uncharacterized protein YyaL (SSP411 family)